MISIPEGIEIWPIEIEVKEDPADCLAIEEGEQDGKPWHQDVPGRQNLSSWYHGHSPNPGEPAARLGEGLQVNQPDLVFFFLLLLVFRLGSSKNLFVFRWVRKQPAQMKEIPGGAEQRWLVYNALRKNLIMSKLMRRWWAESYKRERIKESSFHLRMSLTCSRHWNAVAYLFQSQSYGKTGLSPYWSMSPNDQAHKQKEMTNHREWLNDWLGAWRHGDLPYLLPLQFKLAYAAVSQMTKAMEAEVSKLEERKT